MSSDLEGDLVAGKEFTVRVGNIKNLSYDKFSGKFAVALFDAEGAFKCTLSKIDGMTLAGMAIYPSASVAYLCRLPEGTAVADGDMIRMATSADNGQTWLPMAGELVTVNEIPAKGAVPQYFSVSTPGAIQGAAFTGDSKVIKGWNYTFRVVPSNPERDVVTVKGNGYLLTPGTDYTYTINNVLDDMEIAVYVQPASEVKEKRSIWVGQPGTLETLIQGADAGTIKDLTLFGTIDARDFAFMKASMKLTRLDLSGVRIAANGTNQANAIPRDAFRNLWSLKEVILPSGVNRLNNGCFRSCGITSIVIPAAVNTYEYNVFNGASYLKDVWVLNPTPAFVNWCVFRGTPSDRTVHCVNMGAAGAYKQNKYWNQPDIDANVTFTCPWQDKQEFPTVTDCAFAVMEDKDVKFTCDTDPGRYAPGTKIIFKAEHIADDDNRMDVYANSTLLKPDAEGYYSTTLAAGTIIHFDLVEPAAVSELPSPWVLTDATGSVGLLTDAVNVMPGVPFTIRVNAFDAPSKAFWAAVLTTADGRIKEFISPVSNWSAEPGTNFRMNISCCVKEATVREGNLIRLVTSIDKKNWKLVQGANDNVIAALPALNNTTPVYNFTFPEGIEKQANLSGIVTSTVRGRDLTFKITPKSAGNVITMLVNGVPYVKEAKSVSYSFVAKEDIDFDIRVISPDQMEAVVFDLQPGERLWDPNNKTLMEQRRNALRPKVVVKGNIDYTDLALFREIQAWNTVVSLDLSGAVIVADRSNAKGYPANVFPANAFCPGSNTTANIKLKELKFPASVTSIGASALYKCDKIKELELPVNLDNFVGSGWWNYAGGLKKDCFLGCTSLTTLYVPCVPKNGSIVHHINTSHGANQSADCNNLGLNDCSKVTVVVNPDYLKAYTTRHDGADSDDWRNLWVYNGFNIVGEYPVYGVNYQVDRCFVSDKSLDIKQVVSFLGNNIPLESIDFSGKLYVGAKSAVTANRPDNVDAYDASRQVKVYDNGKLLGDDKIADDGSIALTYYNPNKHADKSGDHNIEVVYLYDVTFNCVSGNIKIAPEVRNNESLGDAATEFEYLNYYNAAAPVLQGVKEDSQVRFKVSVESVDESRVRPMVKVGESVVSADDEGYYTVDVNDTDVTVNVFTVPVNGAELSPAEVEVIDPEEAVDVTHIALSGGIAPEKVKEIVDKLPALQELDLSELSEALPEGAMAGKETLVTVILPGASVIEANTFEGCTNLTNVVVPECVNVIGADAFKNCRSLKNLSFSGITGIGANAFNGCDRLTGIIFTAARPDAAPARVRRSAGAANIDGYEDDAFAGLNPNCFVYLDEGVTAPDVANVNYIQVRQDASSESGRVYEALGNIVISPENDFQVVNAFSITEGNTISMEMPLNTTDSGDNGWKPLVLPFTPTMVTDTQGNEMTQYTRKAVSNSNGLYMTASFDAKGNLGLTEGIKANTPYLAALFKNEGNASVRFVAGACEVPQTPDEISAEGAEYTLGATFSGRDVEAAGTYLLREDGSAFDEAVAQIEPLAESDADGMAAAVALSPFTVYAVSGSGVSNIPVDVDVTELKPTGITAPEQPQPLVISRDGDSLVICSDCDTAVDLFNVAGMHVRTLELVKGRNVVDGILPGVYILGGKKVVL